MRPVLVVLLLTLLSACAAAPQIPALDTAQAAPRPLAQKPINSPDNSRFLIANGASSNALEIWRRDAEGSALEWAYGRSETPLTARVLSWKHAGRIDVVFSDAAQSWTGTLMRDEEGWHLRADGPQPTVRP